MKNLRNEDLNLQNISDEMNYSPSSIQKKIKKIATYDSKEILSIQRNSKNEINLLQSHNSNVVSFNLEQNKITYKIPGFYNGVCGFDVSTNSKYFIISNCTSTNEYSATIGNNTGFLLYDLESGKQLHTFFSSINPYTKSSISHNKQYLATTSHTNKSQIFDLKTGKVKHILNTEYTVSSEFSLDNNYLVTTSDKRAIDVGSDLGKEIVFQDSKWIWDISTGQLIDIIEYQEERFYNSENIYSVSVSYKNPKTATIWKANGGLADPYKDLIGHTDSITSTVMSKDEKIVVTSSKDNTVKVWDVSTGQLIYDFIDFKQAVSSILINDKNIVTKSKNNVIKIWSRKSRSLLHTIPLKSSKDNEIIPNNNYKIVIDYENDQLKVYEPNTNQFIRTLKDSDNGISSFKHIPSSNYIMTSLSDGSIVFWDLDSGKQLIRQYVFNHRNPFWLLPNGNYFASKEAAQKIFYKKELQTLGFEQLDVKYNRPDKVLEVLGDITGADNSKMINAYKKAWEKRIRKLDIDTTSFRQGFSVPESEFYNRDNIAYEQSKSELKLRIKGSDNTYKLDRFNVWINEVPVYGRKGISLKSRNIKSLDTTITVELSQGENRIETSILNVNGIESFRQPIYVNYTPKKDIKERLYFVGIGVDKYQEEGNDLNYSVKDIKDLSIQLKEKYGRQIQIDTLFNQNVTVSNIKKLKDRLKSSKVDDKVIISFSGHGLLSKDLDYYLATHNVNFSSPEEKGLPYEDLEYLLDGIPSRQKLLLIDACHSGEVDKEEVESIHEVEKLKEGLKGSIGVRTKKPKMGMKNSFELMKELFNNVDRATGATVISAAAGTEFAQERGNLKNGVFTYCILNQLREKETISVSELKQLVSEQVKEITNGLQQPTSRNETIENDWRVW